MIKLNHILIFSTSLILISSNYAFSVTCNIQQNKDISSDVSKACYNSSDFSSCVSKIERNKIKKFPSVIRNANTLKLKLKNGKYKTFVDNKNAGEETRSTEFVDYLTEYGFYIIRQNSYESSNYFFINDKTGKETFIEGVVVFSPDNKSILNFSNGYDSSLTGFQVWSLSKNKITLTKQFNDIPEISVGWNSNSQICYESSGKKYLVNIK